MREPESGKIEKGSVVVKLLEVRELIPVLFAKISEIGSLLLPSRDMT